MPRSRFSLPALFVGVALSLSILTGAQAQQPLHAALSISQLHVLDSSREPRTLGAAHFPGTGNLFEVSVILEVSEGEQFVLLPVEATGFQRTRVNLGFSSPDCSGQPYLVTVEPHFLFTPAAITEPRHTLWVPTGESATPIFIESIRVPVDAYFPTGCHQNLPDAVFGIPAHAAVELDTLFLPPFRLASVTHIHRQTKRTFTGPALTR